jgi:hypothetical protein
MKSAQADFGAGAFLLMPQSDDGAARLLGEVIISSRPISGS